MALLSSSFTIIVMCWKYSDDQDPFWMIAYGLVVLDCAAASIASALFIRLVGPANRSDDK